MISTWTTAAGSILELSENRGIYQEFMRVRNTRTQIFNPAAAQATLAVLDWADMYTVRIEAQCNAQRYRDGVAARSVLDGTFG